MSADEVAARELAGKFVTFLETGTPPEGLFRPSVFLDFTMPLWREQAEGIEDAVALRKRGHPAPGTVSRSRFDSTATGFVLEVEEQWNQDGQSWYCREMFWADVSDGSISALSVYCTGDWDAELVRRHARSVRLLRA